MSDLSKALDQISEIHDHLSKSEVYRGWRPVPVAASALIGIGAAWYQAALAKPIEPVAFVVFWLVVAVMALVIGCAEIVWHYARHATTADRRRSRLVLGQFLPALLAGAIGALALLRVSPALATLLPGLWALLFGVGIFAARPYLPNGARLVAGFYWITGVVLLWTCRDFDTLSPWMVGGPFAVGQLLSAAVLYWTLERGGGHGAPEGDESDEND
jgi:hypothetical protein